MHNLLARWLNSGLDRFARRYDYDAAYMKDVVDANPSGGLKLALATGFLGHDFGTPPAAYFAAKVRSTRRADCGPCLRLVLNMAEEAGVATERLLPVFGHGEAASEVALAIRYADAVMDDSPELPEILGEVRARFGESGQVGLAAAVVAGQFYPLLKRAMGHAVSCEPVVQSILKKAGRNDADGFDSDRNGTADGVS